jgi:hypothetical protein
MPTCIPTERIITDYQDEFLDWWSRYDAYSNGLAAATDGSAYFSQFAGAPIVGWQGSKYHQMGYTFISIPIPAGVTIVSASILVATGPDGGGYGATDLFICAEKVVGPGIWTANHRPGTGGTPGRGPETTAKVLWSRGSWAANTVYQTPDLSPVVQELVDQGGWASGSSMAFIFRGNGDQTGFTRFKNIPAGFSGFFDCCYVPVGGAQAVRISII